MSEEETKQVTEQEIKDQETGEQPEVKEQAKGQEHKKTVKELADSIKRIPLDKQSIEIQPGLRTNPLRPEGVDLVTQLYPGVTTVYEIFKRGLSISGTKNCLGARTGPKREYEWITYEEAHARAQQLGSGFLLRGLKVGQNSNVGIYANNCVEWTLTSLALEMYSMVSVPLYDTLGQDACTFIINKADVRLVVCDKVSKCKALLEKKSETPILETLVVLEIPSEDLVNEAKEAGVTVVTFHQVMEEGKTNIKDVVPPNPDDLYTICYTSGTTGNPKGVMLTHANVVSACSAVTLNLFDKKVSPHDIHFSYLPLAHIFERVMQEGVFQEGGSVGFYSGDVKLLTDDLQALKPSIMPIVPRLLNRIYDKVQQQVSGSVIKRFLFNMALRKKTDMLKKGVVTKTSLWDKLVFGKVQALIGGNIRLALVGAAPTAPEVLTFARCAFGCDFGEGYGQTECTAGLTVSNIGETEAGHVGAPLSNNIVKLVDIPDMEYYVKDNKGEVCCKGPNVMKGYYKDPEPTAEALDEEGWLHTGDVGQWLPNGTLKIIDRKKHIFKLAQGEYVAPEKIEGIYNRSPLVAQSFVDAHSLETHTVAIIVPDEEALGPWMSKNGLKGASLADLCKNSKLKADIMKSITDLGKEKGLKGFEQVKNIYLHPEQFTIENGLLTPTFKSKRPQLRNRFATEIDRMYRQEVYSQDVTNRNVEKAETPKSSNTPAADSEVANEKS